MSETLKKQYERLKKLQKVENIREQLISNKIDNSVLEDFSGKHGSQQVNTWYIEKLNEELHEEREAFDISLYDYVHLYKKRLNEYTVYNWEVSVEEDKDQNIGYIYHLYLSEIEISGTVINTLELLNTKKYAMQVVNGNFTIDTIKNFDIYDQSKFRLADFSKNNVEFNEPHLLKDDENLKKALKKIDDEIWDMIEQNRLNLIEEKIKGKQNRKAMLKEEVLKLDYEISSMKKHYEEVANNIKKGKKY